MKRTLLLFAFVPVFAHAQNLVPNPGFEDYVKLPCTCMQYDLSEYIKDWNSLGNGTPDVLYDYSEIGKDCYASTNSTSSISFGNEKPHGGHGEGMIMTTAHGDSYREYLGATLNEPLKKGKKYSVEFFVSLGDKCQVATNNLGMAFFTGVFTKQSSMLVSANPQINITAVINQTDGWYKVSGIFTASDAYTYFAIGNFLSTTATQIDKRNVAAGTDSYSYNTDIAAYYIDDVTVKPVENSLEVTGDTLVAIGTEAHLIATGSKTYSWAEYGKPAKILSTTDQLTVKMDEQKTFVVTGEGGSKNITVKVLKPDAFAMQELNGRKVKKGRTIEVHSRTIEVTLFDKDEVDGDSVSIYFGDSAIVENLSLTHKKKTYEITLDPAHPKQLVLYAVNMGKTPPNTCAIIIKDGKNSSNVVLSSDLKTCDAVMLVYKESPK
ncbi:MAG: hypothetical protein HY064_07285 [Bacteroidetes bacterium]|nr:hypothetical protein [Bacteroidota bacterium]